MNFMAFPPHSTLKAFASLSYGVRSPHLPETPCRLTHRNASVRIGSGRICARKEIDFLPSGALRWWLLGLIVLGWAVEQYEGLKTGPVLVYVLKDFDKTLTEWGYVAACAGFVYSGGAVLLSRAPPIASAGDR